jgi:hypothetical protein
MTTKTMTETLAVAVALACLAAGPVAAQSTDDAPYRASELVQRWSLIITETFDDQKAFTSDEYVDAVGDAIDQFLSIGAVRAVKDRASAQQLKNADVGVRKFARAMVAAGDRQTDGSTHVTDESFQAARKVICPLYPFCQ